MSHPLAGPPLPTPRGPLSEVILETLRQSPAKEPPPAAGPSGDALGEDLQLALYCCYELHYQGFDGVDPAWEWNPGLLALRATMERAFLAVLREGVGEDDDVAGALDALLAEPADAHGVSHHLRDDGDRRRLREYAAHRSIYHLKEADPHAWAIPRLRGTAKAALVAVEFDEFGGGRPEMMHSRLFADLLRVLGLDDRYGAYLELAPAVTLATVNMMSLFGLHRALRGALVGHFAAAEITTAPSARRMAEAMDRMGYAPDATLFYTEHIEADAVHEQVLRRDVIGDLLRREPGLAGDVVLGIRATEFLEDRLGEHLLGRWRDGLCSLRAPLP
ncbi:iron-containing redox enzyme family protein [Spirillospora sp. CA-294931]|uniref:iron-containing redox enzyme family protein n=1 Tax=Spirillospora sp. CA-294931 TaxID=3240042 RepID=UPI003D932C02